MTEIHKKRQRGVRPETEAKYRKAVALYGSTQLSCREICRICDVTPSGLQCHIFKYHRELMPVSYTHLTLPTNSLV